MARHPNITPYKARGKTFWRISIRLPHPTIKDYQFRRGKYPTFEIAKRKLAEVVHDAYEGNVLRARSKPAWTVKDALEFYRPVAERKNKSGFGDKSRRDPLIRHLGTTLCEELHEGDIDVYREKRRGETTRRGTPPAPATLDREVELLKRVLYYSLRCKKIAQNPLRRLKLLCVPNVRDVVVTPAAFEHALTRLGPRSAWMREPLMLSFETGMRIGEVLQLPRSRIDWQVGRLELKPCETKTKKPRIVYLSRRLLEALKKLPAHVSEPWLFFNPATGKPRSRPRKGFKAAFGQGVNVHDLRRSFATWAIQKAKIPESVVLSMGGWVPGSIMPKRYNIVQEESLLEAARQLEAMRAMSTERAESHDGVAK